MIKLTLLSHGLQHTLTRTSLIHLSGDEDLQSRLRTLCMEFADIFSNELSKDPADITPFNLIVDDTKWSSVLAHFPLRDRKSVV